MGKMLEKMFNSLTLPESHPTVIFLTISLVIYQLKTWITTVLFSNLILILTFVDGREVCFKQVAVGPASYQLGGPGSSHVSKQDIIRFRDVLYVYKHKNFL